MIDPRGILKNMSCMLEGMRGYETSVPNLPRDLPLILESTRFLFLNRAVLTLLLRAVLPPTTRQCGEEYSAGMVFFEHNG
jgi:hypothetical protein